MKENTVVDNEYQGKEIRLCEDGKYRWVYELPILRNPTIFLTVFKVMVLVVGVVWLFMVLIFAFQGDLNKEMFMFTLKMLGIMMAIFMGLMIISILVLAAIYGGRYVFLFEMDENGVTQNLMPRQYKKAQAIALITTIVGLLAKNPTTVGGSTNGSIMIPSMIEMPKSCMGTAARSAMRRERTSSDGSSSPTCRLPIRRTPAMMSR